MSRLDRQAIRQVTKHAQRQLVLNLVPHYAAIPFIPNPMAVVKILERPSSLLITEMIIPAKLSNIRVPLQSHWKQGNRAKTDGDY
jgi:hypothetical protein